MGNIRIALLRNLLLGTIIVVSTVGEIKAQSFDFYGLEQFDTRDMARGMTGIIDSKGPFSVFSNPALNRSGRGTRFLPFYYVVGNGRWDNVIELPQRLDTSGAPADENNQSEIDKLDGNSGLTYWSAGALVQMRGVTLGFYESDRDEFMYDSGIFSPLYRGRHFETKSFIAGYSLTFESIGRIGALFRQYEYTDSGERTAAISSILEPDDIGDFLDVDAVTSKTALAFDVGAIFVLDLPFRSVTVGGTVKNLLGDMDGTQLDPVINLGFGLYPFSGLLIEFNYADVTDTGVISGEDHVRFGAEYSYGFLLIRGGSVGEKVSFGVGMDNGSVMLDYGVFEDDHNGLVGTARETYQAIQISLNAAIF